MGGDGLGDLFIGGRQGDVAFRHGDGQGVGGGIGEGDALGLPGLEPHAGFGGICRDGDLGAGLVRAAAAAACHGQGVGGHRDLGHDDGTGCRLAAVFGGHGDDGFACGHCFDGAVAVHGGNVRIGARPAHGLVGGVIRLHGGNQQHALANGELSGAGVQGDAGHGNRLLPRRLDGDGKGSGLGNARFGVGNRHGLGTGGLRMIAGNGEVCCDVGGAAVSVDGGDHHSGDVQRLTLGVGCLGGRGHFQPS